MESLCFYFDRDFPENFECYICQSLVVRLSSGVIWYRSSNSEFHRDIVDWEIISVLGRGLLLAHCHQVIKNYEVVDLLLTLIDT